MPCIFVIKLICIQAEQSNKRNKWIRKNNVFTIKLSSNKTFVRSGQNRPQNGIIWPRQKDSMFFFLLLVCMGIIRFVTKQKRRRFSFLFSRKDANNAVQRIKIQKHKCSLFTVQIIILFHILHPIHKYSHWMTQNECICARYYVEPFHSKTFICCMLYVYDSLYSVTL